jgi:hypothetical protein
MINFDYACQEHGRFEILLEKHQEKVDCPKCGKPSEWIPWIGAMKPDPNWHFGEYVRGHGYLQSSSQIARAKKSQGIETLCGRSDIEGMKKEAESGKKSREAKEDRERLEHFEKVFSATGVVDSFGEITPEALRLLSDTPINSSNDERLSY